MNIDELKKLIGAIAASDRRTISKVDVDFWAAMSHEGSWTLNAAMQALIQFRVNRPGEWLEPGHITGIIREARRKAAATFEAPAVPDEITGREYPAWYRAQLAAHVDEVLAAWAAGEPIPESPAELESSRGRAALPGGIEASTCPPELREQIERDLARAGRMDRLPPRPAEPVRRAKVDDPERRAQARAELAALTCDTTDEDSSSRDGAA